jgi:ElaB/YqjD/DUF883 family membrane-anchored ribosome-binding protein
MNKNDDLRVEVEALRREVEALRAERSAAGAGEVKEEETGQERPPGLTDQLLTLSREISDLAESTEESVVSHPLTSVLGALVLGILIGRILPR